MLLLPWLPPWSWIFRLSLWASILLHGPLDICLDLLPAAPLPPMQKQTHGTYFYSTGGHTPNFRGRRFRRGMPQESFKVVFNQKNPFSVHKMFVRNSGAGNGCVNFMDAWKKCVLSAGKTHVRKIARFRGGDFGFGGGGKCRFYFYGRADFSDFKSPENRRTTLKMANLPSFCSAFSEVV